MRSRLTPKTIDEAIERLPEAWQNLRGDFLRDRLVTRLENLREQAFQLYERIARETHWIGSGQKETWRVKCRVDGSLRLEVALDRESTASARRLFWPDEANRIEIWTLGGDDTEEPVDRHRCQIDFILRRPEQGDFLPKRVRGVPNWK